MNIDYNLTTAILTITLNSLVVYQGNVGSFFADPPPGFCTHFDVCRTFHKAASAGSKTIHVVPPAYAVLFGIPIPIPPPVETLTVYNQSGLPENWSATVSGSGLNLPAASGFQFLPVSYQNIASLPVVPNTTISFVNVSCPGALNNPLKGPVAIRVRGCAPNLAVTGNPVTAGIYRSSGTLTASNATVVSGSTVQFRADTGILLSPEFTVILGADFTALIEMCLPTSLGPPPSGSKVEE